MWTRDANKPATLPIDANRPLECYLRVDYTEGESFDRVYRSEAMIHRSGDPSDVVIHTPGTCDVLHTTTKEKFDEIFRP